MHKSFGTYIRDLRGQESRRAVAERAGFTAEYLRKIENSDQVPQKDKQLALAKALKVEARDLLNRALRQENETAHRLLTTVRPRFPRLRQTLKKRLEGLGSAIICRDMGGLPLTPCERQALILWSTVLEMFSAGPDPERDRTDCPALELARKRSVRPIYVEGPLCDFVADHLLSWRVDPETGLQTHKTGDAEVADLLVQAGWVLGLYRPGPVDEVQASQ